MDPRWNAFAGVCRQEFTKCEFQDRLIGECAGMQDVAWAIFYHCREKSLLWLQGKIPALHGEVPAVLLASGRADEVRYCGDSHVKGQRRSRHSVRQPAQACRGVDTSHLHLPCT
jgi:hypothetical protein